eukprot:gene30495-35513_t
MERKRRAAGFKELLEATHGIKATSEWRKVAKKLEEEDATSEWRKVSKKLEGEDAFESLDKLERLEVFQDFIRDLEKREKEEKESEKVSRKRHDRIARDAFKDMLLKHRLEGLISVKTRFKEYSRLVSTDEVFLSVEKCTPGSSRPKDLFEYFIEDMEEEYDRSKDLFEYSMEDMVEEYDRSKNVLTDVVKEHQMGNSLQNVLKDLVKEHQMGNNVLKDLVKEHQMGTVSSATTFEDWLAALEEKAGQEVIKKMEASYMHTYFEELVGRARLREEEEADRKRRYKDKLGSLIRHARPTVTASTTWEDFLKSNEQEPEIKTLGIEESKAVFEEYLLKLHRKAEKRRKHERSGSDSEEEGRRTDKKSRRDDDSGYSGDEGERSARRREKKHKKEKKSR